MMNLAIAIFKYFPFGGIQHDFMRIAEAAHRRGHRITVYAYDWKGPVPDFLDLKLLRVRAFTNHRKAEEFFGLLRNAVRANPPDLLLGFNRGPGLDVYFAGDNCFTLAEQEKHGGMYRFFNKRYAVYAELERAVFSPESRTVILYLVEAQKRQYIKCFHTPEKRFRLLPPGMNPACRRGPDGDAIRAAKRAELKVADGEIMLLVVAANLMLKGADRVIESVAALPENLKRNVKLFLVGRDAGGRLKRLVQQNHLEQRVFFEGLSSNVREYLLAADLMVHPARNEATGTVLIEAIAAGLPVVCTDNCGFSKYVAESHSGCVISGRFDPMELNLTLQTILWEPSQLKQLSRYGLEYAETADFYSRAEKAVDILEELAHAAGK